MIFFKLLKLDWKSFIRSASFGKSLAIKIFLAFITLYFFVCFLALGFGLFFILKKLFSNEEPIIVANNFLLLWFCLEFIIRFLMQNLPVVNIKPLLVQRISRNRIVHSLLGKSFYSFYNTMTLTIALPFVLVNLKESDYTAVQLFSWLLGVMGFVFFLNYLNLWTQKRLVKGIKTLLPFIALLLVLFGLEYTQVFSITKLFGSFYTLILAYPVLAFIPIVLAILTYRLVFNDVKAHLYLDAYLEKKENSADLADLSWLEKFGVLAPFIQLDLKLIMRNKRAKNTVLLSLFILLYGLIFYTNSSFGGGSGMFVFVGIFMTGIFVVNFGQFIPAWDSAYFPLLRTQPIDVRNYLTSKVLLMYMSVFILTVLSLFYAYFGWDKVYLNVACAVYNLGINIPIILLFSTLNRKRIDLDNSSIMNYQGLGIAQWLIGIPLFLLPLIIWGAFNFMFSESTANNTLIVIGIIGLLFHKLIIRSVADVYVQNRYRVLEGFKQKG